MGPKAIVDVHCHVAAEMCFPRAFRDGIVENIRVSLASGGVDLPRVKIAQMLDATFQDPLCDELVAQMDDAGIELAVLQLPDFTYALASDHSIEELIEHHRLVLARHPGRFKVFVGVDPRWGDDGIALFERSIDEYGFDGMKLYPPCGYRLSDPALHPFFEICSAARVPVLTHIGATAPALDFEIAEPIHVDAPARAFPAVDFVLAHGSVHYPDVCAMLCNNRPNVYLDVSGFESFPLSGLRSIFARGINHKILFGTDWPVFRLQGEQSEFVRRLRDDGAFPDDLPARDRELFFGGNAERLLARRVLPRAAASTLGHPVPTVEPTGA